MSDLGKGQTPADPGAPRTAPRTTRPALLWIAVVLLVIPVVALGWVSLYAKDGPELLGFPFFFWYQFLWVFLTAGFTYTAHRLVLAARGQSHKGIA